MTHKDDPNYLNATEQEKKWFDLFVESKDLLAATHGAYRMNGDDSARSYGKSVIARPHMAALIKSYCTPQSDLPTAEDLKRMYIDITRDGNATVRDKLTALQAYERLAGFTVKGKPIATPTDDPFAGIDD